MSLTLPTAQWTVQQDGTAQLIPLTWYVVGGAVRVSTDPADAVGNTIGYLKTTGSDLTLDTALTGGLASVVAPGSRVLAYS